MLSASHAEKGGEAERANGVVEDILRSYPSSFTPWSSMLPMFEFATNNASHSSIGPTPFLVNYARHSRVPAALGLTGGSYLGRGCCER